MCLIPSPRTKKLDKKNYDALSIPGCVMQKNLTRGAKHGASERQRMHYKAKKMLQNARQPKHGGYKTILKRWHKDYKYHESVADIGWTEEQIIQHDQLALEDHSKSATSEERDRTEKSWVLKLNKEGSQGPMNQGRDFVEATREMKRLHDEHAKEISEGNTPIHLVQRSRQRRHQQCEGLEEYNFYVDAQTGWRTCTSKSQGNLSQNPTHLSSSTQWEQHDDWKSKKSWTYWRSSSWTEQQCFFCSEMLFHFSLAGKWMECRQKHLPHATFSHVQSLHRSHSSYDMCAWLKELKGSSLSSVPKISQSSTRLVSSCASQHIEHQHKFSLTCISCVTVALFCESRPVVHLSINPLRRCTAGWSGNEPKRIELDRNLVNPQNQIIDDLDDMEEIGVKQSSYSQSLINSDYDSAGSIATPPDSDLEDEHLREMLASPL